MTEIKNILIIGGMGVGRTTLANVLSGTNGFKEDNSSCVQTWRAKDKEFKDDNGAKYRVIDTDGLGSTNLNKEELLEKFEEEIGAYIDEGISQIFFVINGRFPEKVLEEFLWLNKYLFNKKAFDYTTIVRTNFEDFEKKDKCKEDTDGLVKFFDVKNKEIYEEFKKEVLGEGKIVYINNSSIDIKPINTRNKKRLELNKKYRVSSRKKLWDHLNNFNNNMPYKPDIRKWLDEKHPEEKRKTETVLDISRQNLKGVLRLKGFISLKWLNCSDNQLTNLDLSDCKDLVELRCNDNEFANLNFLKSVGKLERLYIQNNPKLSPQNLKSLQNLSKLEELNINKTNFSEGLEYLPVSCKILYCDNEKIMKELSKCLVEEHRAICYNLDKWRETNKQDSIAASVIPLERLFIIRSNIKKFINKWSKEIEDNWYKRCERKLINHVNSWKGKPKIAENTIELDKLKHPDEFSKQWGLIAGIQWVNRASLVVGGSLILAGAGDENSPYTKTGGLIAIASPFVEIVTSQVNDKIYDVKQKKWDEFVEDAKNLLDNYHELLGILEKIEISKFGEINKVLKKLDKAADSFLEIYDEDENWTIDIAELISQKAREELAEDLTKESSKLGNIVKVMEELEDKIIEYRQGMTNKENIEQKSKSKRQQAKKKKVLKITTDNQSNEKGVKETNQSQVETHQVIDLDKWEKEKLENQTEVPPKGNN